MTYLAEAVNGTVRCLPYLLDSPCEYIQSKCSGGGLHIWWLTNYYCQSRVVALVGALLFLTACFVALGITAADYLCPNLCTISKAIGLSEDFAGLTLLAFGNGAPDIMSTFKAISMGEGLLALSELLGSCLFIITFVVGIISLIHPIKVNPRMLYGNIAMFMLMDVFMFISIAEHKLTVFLCFALIIAYVAYILVVMMMNHYDNNRLEAQISEARARANFDVEAGRHDTGEEVTIENFETAKWGVSGTFGLTMMMKDLSRYSQAIYLEEDEQGHAPDQVAKFAPTVLLILLAFIHPIRWTLLLFIPVRDANATPIDDNNADKQRLIIQCVAGSIWLTFSLLRFKWYTPFVAVAAAVGIAYFVSQMYRHHNLITNFAAVFGFLVAIQFILLIAGNIVTVLQFLGIIWHLSNDILGLTIFAWGNSIGDLISNVTIAKMGMPVMAFGACFGGPLLAMTCLGTSGLLSMSGSSYPLHVTLIGSTAAIMIILNCAYLLYIVPRNSWTIDGRIGQVLIANFGFCMILCVILELFSKL